MASIACPVCAGPVAVIETRPDCERDHASSEPSELQADLEREASEAMLSAVRALEDWITGARWLLTQPGPPPHLQFETDQAARHAEILRELMESRRQGAAQAPN